MDLLKFIERNSDPRVTDWPLMGSPLQIIAIVVSYIAFVKVVGPSHMKDRKPYRIKELIIAYNILMVIANGWFVVVVARNTYFGGGYSFFCERVDSGTETQQRTVLTASYVFMFTKIIELLDTVFFVLTKKNSNISRLHVIHHSVISVTVWAVVNFGGASGQNVMFSLINGTIHFIMYAYYAMAALGMHRYLWWKRYLTQLQMAQFIFLSFHSSIPVFKDCGFPPVWGYVTILQTSLFFGLFFNFYLKTYKDKISAVAGGGKKIDQPQAMKIS